ncbi:YtpI family protein [Cytobacillus sp. NCCP-133]|uniref:YtpI family protein n=1 Tax=Cytobacillus sp. NCCP-133 TaxID=766848 RepID=UPI00223146AD|nr:YtpI family protein [Cytobacillus sp. NCCP-133]GLB58489.1 membrane protein [Cytobacillus sp. NCCP-133]
MPILVILIVLSFSFYIFYKVKFFRSKQPAERQWISAKSRTALGAFVAFFGLNQLFLYDTTASLIIGILFILVGGLSIWGGIKAYKFHIPHAVKEAEEARKN